MLQTITIAFLVLHYRGQTVKGAEDRPMSWLPALRNLAGKAGLGKPGDSEVDTNSLFPSPRCCFPSVLRLGPSGAAFTTDAPGCSHPAPGLQHAFGGGGKGGSWA